MPPTSFFSLEETAELIDAVSATLPRWLSYHAFSGRPHARPLAMETISISEDRIAAALTALRMIPDAIAEDAELEQGWRTTDLVTALRAWGWAADTFAGTVRIGGIWGDVVFPVNFTALLAVASFTTSTVDPWVFGADREIEPALALAFVDDGLTVHSDVAITYQIAYQVD